MLVSSFVLESQQDVERDSGFSRMKMGHGEVKVGSLCKGTRGEFGEELFVSAGGVDVFIEA